MMGGTMLLPDILKAWNNPTVIENPFFRFTSEQDALIAEVAETIIPTTDTPGAKAAGVPDFIKKMLADCYEQPVRDEFMRGLTKLDTDSTAKFGKSFVNCSPDERIEMLKAAALQGDADRKKARAKPSESTLPPPDPFFFVAKSLTVTGYFTSEIGCTQALRYEAVPGKYIGDLPYKKGDKAWAT